VSTLVSIILPAARHALLTGMLTRPS